MRSSKSGTTGSSPVGRQHACLADDIVFLIATAIFERSRGTARRHSLSKQGILTMEIRDYLRMLRRGWPAVVLITTLFVGIAAGYLVLAPKRYDATTVLFVSAANPKSISDLNQSAQFSGTAATTYAEIIDSGTVLAPVARRLRPQMEVDDLGEMVESTVREETTLIDVTVSGTERRRVATIANAVGLSASQIIPELEATATGRDLVRIQQIRPAVEPTRVASPNPKRTLALGFVVGLFVGLAVTIVAQTLDNRIRHVEEVRQLADVSLLAALPPLKRAERRGVVVRDRPSSLAGEAFRTLRTNISVLGSRDQTEPADHRGDWRSRWRAGSGQPGLDPRPDWPAGPAGRSGSAAIHCGGHAGHTASHRHVRCAGRPARSCRT